MNKRSIFFDATFYLLLFLALSTVILVINLLTKSVHGLSGNIVATISTALLLIHYQWKRQIPGKLTVAAFSILAGFAAIVFLFLLQIVAPLLPGHEFDPLRGYELLVPFVVNLGVFALTVRIKGRSLQQA